MLDPYGESSWSAEQSPCLKRIVLAEVLLATPRKPLLLARGAKLAHLLLGVLVSLRDFLLERDERRVRRRSPGSRFVSLLRH
jgi:hypothetical protein